MKKIIGFLLLCISISVFAEKKIQVVSFKQSTSDISARTNQREDPHGIPCALIKVQLPLRNAIFEGDIIGEIAYKTNEYWVYMPQKSTRIEVRLPYFEKLSIDFNQYGISGVESKGTYELCLLRKEDGAPQLYDEGVTALAKNDVTTAFDKLQKASDAGYAPAAYMLGYTAIAPFDRNYDEDPNTQEAYQEAYDYLKKAADKGYPEAQYALGRLLLDYKDGYPEELSKIKADQKFQDQQNIMDLMKQAADNGVREAQYLLLSDDLWCKENAGKGVAMAEFGMGLRFDPSVMITDFPMLESLEISPEEDYETAVKWYRKAADKGLDLAQWRLGDLYAQGLGVPKDINLAVGWRTKAAEQGYYLFQYMMAIMYTYGDFCDFETYSMYNTELGSSPWEKIPQNLLKASYWLKKLNHNELTKTEYENVSSNGLLSSTLDVLSGCLLKEEKYVEAIYWFQREIEMGYRDAYCSLGEMYMNGNGIGRNYDKARIMFEESIKEDKHIGDGYSGQLKNVAKCWLGIIYRDGLGVTKDIEKAKAYLMESFGNDENSMAQYELGMLYKQSGDFSKARNIFFRGGFSGDVTTHVNGEKRYIRINEYHTKILYERGIMNYEGLGGEKNAEEGIEQFKEAASRGSDEAKRKLLELGISVPKQIELYKY